MSVLDIVVKFKQTENVFKKYDKQAGACIFCEALFESIKDVAERYGLDQKRFINDLESSVDILP